MIEMIDERYFDRVRLFAEKTGKLKNLVDNITYLDTYADNSCKCVMGVDFAPASFAFCMMKKDGGGIWVPWFNGGLIYHGDQTLWDENAGYVDPLSVTLTEKDGWSVHT